MSSLSVLALSLLAFTANAVPLASRASPGPGVVDLGTAGTFAILAQSGISSIPATSISALPLVLERNGRDPDSFFFVASQLATSASRLSPPRTLRGWAFRTVNTFLEESYDSCLTPRFSSRRLSFIDLLLR